MTDQPEDRACGRCEDGCVHGTTTPCPHCKGRMVIRAERLVTAEDRAAHVEREAVALAIDYLSRATGGIQSDATDAAATYVNVGDLRRVLRVLAALPQTGDAAACEVRALADRARGASNFYRHLPGAPVAFASLADDLDVLAERAPAVHSAAVIETPRTGAASSGVCTDPGCPIYARHRSRGQTFPPHGPHDFRAAGADE